MSMQFIIGGKLLTVQCDSSILNKHSGIFLAHNRIMDQLTQVTIVNYTDQAIPDPTNQLRGIPSLICVNEVIVKIGKELPLKPFAVCSPPPSFSGFCHGSRLICLCKHTHTQGNKH